jgi:hypothetical protein
LAFNSNDDDSETLTMDPVTPADEGAAPAGTATAQPTASSPASPAAQSAAFIRFRSCRWHQPAENGMAEFCTHREVKPYAGTTGFDPEAWCQDCQYYKLRRSPKKKAPVDDYGY